MNMNMTNKWSRFFNNINQLNKVIDKTPTDSIIVYTYGAWDLLHPGHVNFLNRARDLGDFLIVGVVGDNPIKKLKGIDRPIQKQSERLIVVGSLRCIDAVISQPEYDPSSQLNSLNRVNILTKGDDWDYIPGTETIEKVGGKLIKFSYTEGFSTSQTVNKLNSK